MAFSTQELIEWYEIEAEDLYPAIDFSMNNLPEGQPNRCCAVRRSGGLGLELEDALDRPSFQLLVRGVNARDAEASALALDQIWIDAPSIFYIGSTRVLGKGRLSGEPSFVGEDQSEEYPGRILYSATYWARVARY